MRTVEIFIFLEQPVGSSHPIGMFLNKKMEGPESDKVKRSGQVKSPWFIGPNDRK